jgi:arylsulfatase A-like enzyme
MSAGIPLNVQILPELLKDKGYERHMIGKWHCGYAVS